MLTITLRTATPIDAALLAADVELFKYDSSETIELNSYIRQYLATTLKSYAENFESMKIEQPEAHTAILAVSVLTLVDVTKLPASPINGKQDYKIHAATIGLNTALPLVNRCHTSRPAH